MRWPLVATLIGILAAGAAIGFLTDSAYSQNSPSWSQLHGVNYLYTPLVPWNPTTAPPSSFSEMVQNGWNLIRVPLGWNKELSNPQAFIAGLQAVADSADSNGLYVVYDFHAINQNGWPLSLYDSYPSADAFYSAWWANQTTFEGTNGWQAQFNDVWRTVISTVDSHPSTLGYEIMNEPPETTKTNAAGQLAYNQYVYDNIRAISSKFVIFCNPFLKPGGGPDKSPLAAQTAKPNGFSVVLDVHDYGATGSSLASDLAGWSSVTGLSGIFMGEFGQGSPTLSAASTYYGSVYSELKAYGIGSTVWVWQCGGNTALLDNKCNQTFVDAVIVNAYSSTSTNSFASTSIAVSSFTQSQNNSVQNPKISSRGNGLTIILAAIVVSSVILCVIYIGKHPKQVMPHPQSKTNRTLLAF